MNHRIQLFEKCEIKSSTNTNTSIDKFAMKSKLLIGKEGVELKKFKSPMGLCFAHTDDRFYVCDRENSRIQHFTLDGDLINKFGILKLTKIN